MDGDTKEKMECGKTERDQHFTESKEQLLHFRRSCLRFRVSSGMDSSSVWNMDQIMCRYCHMYTDCFIFFTRTFMCRFDPLPGATNNIRGAHTVRNCCKWSPKKGFTVALYALAAGEKLPATSSSRKEEESWDHV